MSKKKQKPTAIIVDLDGTLSNCEHRVHLVQQKPKNWPLFYKGLIDDEINEWCSELVRAMQARGHAILLVTGRSYEYHEATCEWLRANEIDYDELHMRASDDFRADTFVKSDLYNQEIRDRFHVLFVVEDRKGVVAMWRELGLTCLQCDEGDF